MSGKQLDFRDEREDVEARINQVQQQRHPLCLLLDQVNNPRNLGGIFRIADAARIEKIFGYQISEEISSKKVQRVARSTQRFVPFQNLNSIHQLEALRENYDIIALEITSESQPFTNLEVKRPTLLIIGNEQEGVSEELLHLADRHIHIPMYGINTSMNVTVATGIAVYHIIQQFQ